DLRAQFAKESQYSKNNPKGSHATYYKRENFKFPHICRFGNFLHPYIFIYPIYILNVKFLLTFNTTYVNIHCERVGILGRSQLNIPQRKYEKPKKKKRAKDH